MDPVTLLTILGLIYGGASIGTGVYENILGQRTQREQIASGERIAKSQGEAQRKLTTESRKSAEKYMQQLLTEKSKERISAKESEMINYFINSQNNQMAMIMQALSGMAQSPFSSVSPSSTSGMTGLMRGSY